MFFVLAKNPVTIMLLLLLMLYWLMTSKKVRPNTALLCLALFSGLLCINGIFAISGQSLNTYAFFFVTILIAYFANVTSPSGHFLPVFFKVLNFYRYQAILSFLLSFLVVNQLSVIDLGDDRVYHTFYYLFYYVIDHERSIGSFQAIRNQGLFWEPGILQLYMNILLFMQLFIYKAKMWSVAITLFIILTTFSTAGYLITTVIFLYKYKTIFSVKSFVKYTPLILFSVVLLSPLMIDNINDKIDGEHAMSSYVRIFDALQSIVIIGDYPWTGIGLTLDAYGSLQESYKQVFGMYSYLPQGNTNSILSTIVFFGIPTGLLIIYALYRQTLVTKNKGIFFLIIFLSLFAEPLLLRSFFMFLVFNGLIEILSKRTVRRKKSWL